MAAAGVEAQNRPKIEVSNFEISLTQIETGAGIIEFFHDHKSGKKRFSFSSTEGEDRRLDETFDLSEFCITKVKGTPVLRLTPHNRDQKSIFITFKSRDSYELFLANSSDRGSAKKAKKSQSFSQLREKSRIAKREVETIYEDHFSEEEIDETDLQFVKRDDVNIRPVYCSSAASQDNLTTPSPDGGNRSCSDSDTKISSEEDGGEEDRKYEEKEDRATEEDTPGPLKSDDDLSNSDSDKKNSSEEDGQEEEEEEDRANRQKEDDRVTMKKRGRSAMLCTVKSDDDELSNSDSTTTKEEIANKEEYRAILEKAGRLAKGRRHRSKPDQSTQSP